MFQIQFRLFLTLLFCIFSSSAFAESCLTNLEKEIPSLVPKGKKLNEVMKQKNFDKEISQWILKYDGISEDLKGELDQEKKSLKQYQETLAKLKREESQLRKAHKAYESVTAEIEKVSNEVFAAKENIKSLSKELRMAKKDFRHWLLSCTLSGDETPEIYNAALKKLGETSENSKASAPEEKNPQ